MTVFCRVLVIALTLALGVESRAEEDVLNIESATVSHEEGLLIINRESRKSKVIPLQAKLTIELVDTIVKGKLTSIENGHIKVDDRLIALNDIVSIGRKSTGTLFKGIGICVLGATVLAGGAAVALSSSQPVLGIAGIVTGVAILSMSPSVFKYGTRYHMDGEWMIREIQVQ